MGFIFHLRSSAFICGQFALLHVSAVKMSPALRPCEKSFRRLLKIECLWRTATLLLRLAGVENRAQAQPERIKQTTNTKRAKPLISSGSAHMREPSTHQNLIRSFPAITSPANTFLALRTISCAPSAGIIWLNISFLTFALLASSPACSGVQ